MKKNRTTQPQDENNVNVVSPEEERCDDSSDRIESGTRTSTAGNTDGGVETEGQDTEGESTELSVEALSAKVEALQDSLLRAKAECKNIQRRGVIERSEALQYGNAKLMESLVCVLDDLERSVAAAADGDDPQSINDGVKLIHANFSKALSDHGLVAIDALHEQFDPRIHEAMMQQASNEHPPGTVLTEVAKGYKLKDRVVRPSKVIVSKQSDEASTDGAILDESG